MRMPATGVRKESVTLPVLGMSCAACQHHVEESLRKAGGVLDAHVDLMAHRATIAFDAGLISPTELVACIRKAGYDAVLPRRDGGARQVVAREHHGAKAALALLSGALIMLLGMPVGMSEGMAPVDHALMRLAPGLYSLSADALRWSMLLITATVMVVAGGGVYRAAWRALRHGSSNMNTLVSLGTGVAFLWSAFATLFPLTNRPVYFDAVPMILGFLLLGKALEGRAKQQALAAVRALASMKPQQARRVRAGQEEMGAPELLAAGEVVRVLPGERFPIDAEICEGSTTVDESLLTGESTPLERTVGGKVLAGSLNYDGAVLCRVPEAAGDTVLDQITRLVEAAQSSRTPMEGLADRASKIFVPTVLVLSMLTFAGWIWATHEVASAISAAVAVLVGACPCAMGLAIPAALTVAVGRGAEWGLLFKGGEAMERLAHLEVVVVDKTGTLTAGHPVLEKVHPLSSFGQEALLRLAAAAEVQSNHPLAHALMDQARQQGLELPIAGSLQVIPGRGLSAQVEGHEILLGNAALFQESFVALPKDVPEAEAGVTRLWMAADGTIAGYFEARDRVAEGAREAVIRLHEQGLRVVMLTGDSPEAARPVAASVGVDGLEAGLDPMGKLNYLRKLQQEGQRVGMVGDGINDAAALAQADAGLAMGSGAELAQEAGDVLLMRSRPESIPASIDLARQTLAVMRQNLAWAVGYNVVGIPLAAGLFYTNWHLQLSPWMASAAMALSSLSVLGNSLRLRGWQAGARNRASHGKL